MSQEAADTKASCLLCPGPGEKPLPGRPAPDQWPGQPEGAGLRGGPVPTSRLPYLGTCSFYFLLEAEVKAVPIGHYCGGRTPDSEQIHCL